jgi:hypothetical protein
VLVAKVDRRQGGVRPGRELAAQLFVMDVVPRIAARDAESIPA